MKENKDRLRAYFDGVQMSEEFRERLTRLEPTSAAPKRRPGTVWRIAAAAAAALVIGFVGYRMLPLHRGAPIPAAPADTAEATESTEPVERVEVPTEPDASAPAETSPIASGPAAPVDPQDTEPATEPTAPPNEPSTPPSVPTAPPKEPGVPATEPPALPGEPPQEPEPPADLPPEPPAESPDEPPQEPEDPGDVEPAGEEEPTWSEIPAEGTAVSCCTNPSQMPAEPSEPTEPSDQTAPIDPDQSAYAGEYYVHESRELVVITQVETGLRATLDVTGLLENGSYENVYALFDVWVTVRIDLTPDSQYVVSVWEE